jgi:uncharacterized protein YecE (DUF72 family)
MTHPGVVEISKPSPPTGTAGGGCPVSLGTCGYSYTEWVDGGFYPAGTKTADMLPLYARSFSIVELNYTWYQIARAEAVARMAAKAPDHFRFAAKLTRTLTHEREENWRDQLRLYRAGIEPLGSRLAAVLIQLPPDFTRTTENRRYLAELLDGLDGLPVAVEFRHVSWAVDPVFAELARRQVTLVTVDVPTLPDLFPSLDVVTNPDLFYVRFHGRNTAGWRTSNMQKKFDYDYSVDELREWAATRLRVLASRAGQGIIFFNNHVRAQAPGNARELAGIIDKGA